MFGVRRLRLRDCQPDHNVTLAIKKEKKQRTRKTDMLKPWSESMPGVFEEWKDTAVSGMLI